MNSGAKKNNRKFYERNSRFGQKTVTNSPDFFMTRLAVIILVLFLILFGIYFLNVKEKSKSSEENFLIIKVFFGSNKLNPQVEDCRITYPLERKIIKTKAKARMALEELLKGPTSNEKEQGYFTSINSGVKIQKLSIENGVAKVDFDEQLEFQVGGSCRVAAIRAQIVQTLKQFPTVKDVVISINGRTEDILQP